MVAIEIKGADELAKRIKNFGGNVAFASAKAINATALDVQKFEVDTQFPAKLTLRSKGSPWQKPGTKFGVNIKPFATKARLYSAIGSQADWLRLQEFGGIKTAAGHRVAIPTEFWKPKNEIMKREKKPRQILKDAKKQAEFIGPKLPKPKSSRPKNIKGKPRKGRKPRNWGRPFVYSGKRMPEGIYVRTGKPRLPIKMLFRLRRSANVKTNLKYGESAKAVIEQKYGDNFFKQFTEALKTAKLA